MRRTVWMLAVVLALSLARPLEAYAQDGLHVYCPKGSQAGVICQALGLAREVQFTDRIEQAEVLALEGSPANTEEVAERVRKGAGLVWALGPEVGAEELSQILGVSVQLSLSREAVGLVPGDSAEGKSLAEQVVWASAPQVRDRLLLQGVELIPLAQAYEDGTPVLAQVEVGEGRVYLFLAFLGDANPQLQDWAYFDYLVYRLVMQAGGRTP